MGLFLKREIVAASFAADASVSVVARRYGVNVNQVFAWRRQIGRRQIGAPVTAVPPSSKAPRPRLVEMTLSVFPKAQLRRTIQLHLETHSVPSPQ